MEHWEAALQEFLVHWHAQEEVIGILVCGSYITGNPSTRSDIDVHIIINDECDWRVRGNQIVNGYLIEYFVNPPQQIHTYFQEDYADRRPMSMTQFITGKIILDKKGTVQQLRKEAQGWKDKEYEEPASPLIEMKKYQLWDEFDNLLACYEAGRHDFELVYYNALFNIYRAYAFLLRVEVLPYDQLYRYFTDPVFLRKYLKDPFPDAYFVQRYVKAAAKTIDRDEKIRLYQELNEYVLSRAGGFHIDGWKLLSKLDLSK